MVDRTDAPALFFVSGSSWSVPGILPVRRWLGRHNSVTITELSNRPLIRETDFPVGSEFCVVVATAKRDDGKIASARKRWKVHKTQAEVLTTPVSILTHFDQELTIEIVAAPVTSPTLT